MVTLLFSVRQKFKLEKYFSFVLYHIRITPFYYYRKQLNVHELRASME